MKLKLFALIILVLLCTLPCQGEEEHHHGPASGESLMGKVHFPVSCSPAAQTQFDTAVAMLHSFWYEESEKAFNQVAATDPNCAMAYWGVAMSIYHPLWAPPSPDDFKRGMEAITKAKALEIKTDREKEYVAAIEAFYKDSDKLDHASRKLAYEKAMEQVYHRYPEDSEAAVFYSLSLISIASPKDKTYENQKKALEILNQVLAKQPQHPGVAHYIIHASDYPPIANLGLSAAQSYAKIAPAVPHALHMPSHIFTRLGLWQDSIQSNLAAMTAGKEYSEKNFPGKAWDQQLHPMDYLMYAYLQTGQDIEAKKLLDDVLSIPAAQPPNGAAAYAFSAVPARYTLERSAWADAAKLELHPADFPWNQFAWAESITHFARGVGAARNGDGDAARASLEKLESLHKAMTEAKNDYGADQVEIERLAVAGWIAHAQKKEDDAEKQLRAASDLEDSTDKDPVTPGSVLPAREQLGDLLLELKRPKDALKEFEASLTVTPNRFNGLYGAAHAAELSGDVEKARHYYAHLVDLCGKADGNRPELAFAKKFLAHK